MVDVKTDVDMSGRGTSGKDDVKKMRGTSGMHVLGRR